MNGTSDTGQLRATARYLEMMSAPPPMDAGDTLMSCGLLPVPPTWHVLRSFWLETTGGSLPDPGPACDFVRAVFRAYYGSGRRTLWTLVRELGGLAGEWSGPAHDWFGQLGWRPSSAVAGEQLTRFATWALRDAWGLELGRSRGEPSRHAWRFAVLCAEARWGGCHSAAQGLCVAFLAREQYSSERDYSYSEGRERLGDYAAAFMDAVRVSFREGAQLRGEG